MLRYPRRLSRHPIARDCRSSCECARHQKKSRRPKKKLFSFFFPRRAAKLFLPPLRRRSYRYASHDATRERQSSRLTPSLRLSCRVSTTSRECELLRARVEGGGGPRASVIDASFLFFHHCYTRPFVGQFECLWVQLTSPPPKPKRKMYRYNMGIESGI